MSIVWLTDSRELCCLSEGEQRGLLSSPGFVDKEGQNMAYIVLQVFLYRGSGSQLPS